MHNAVSVGGGDGISALFCVTNGSTRSYSSGCLFQSFICIDKKMFSLKFKTFPVDFIKI